MNITTAGHRFELDTTDRFLRCPGVGEVFISSWMTVDEWREKRTATKFFDTWRDEGTRKVRVGRWEMIWSSVGA